MDAVQRMRLKAQQSGKLASTSQQSVSTTNDGGQPVIEIEPSNPQVIYIPEYDPAYIWGWGGRQIVVNNSFIHRYNLNASRGGSLSGRSDWSHDAAHRGGVPYSTAAVSARYGGAARQNLQARAESRVQSAGPQQNSARPATERMGNRQIPSNSGSKGNAFGGVREGNAVRSQSDHGFSIMGSRGGGGGGMGGAGAHMGGGGGGHAGGGGRR